MTSLRKLAIATGLCYLITHVTSVPAPFLYAPVLNHADEVLGSGSGTQVLLGAFLEVICALGIIGTAVALFPVVKRQNEALALGYVGLRTLEAGIIAIGIIPLLSIVTLEQRLGAGAGSDTAALVTLGALVEFHKWTRLIGPGLVCGTNTVLMAYLMYRSRLVPRFIPVLGLIGGPLIFAYNTALMFGLSEQIPAWAGIFVLPIFAWEVTLAIRLIVRGFNASAVATEPSWSEVNESIEASLSHA